MAVKDGVVSVIIPAYNAEGSVGRAIESALGQTLPGSAIIVVDDGSTDGTARVIGSYADRVTLLTQENQGQGAARNKGLEQISGKYIAFLDADDYWRPDFLKHCVAFLESHPEAAAVFTAFIKKTGDGHEVILPRIAADPAVSAQPPRLLESFYQFWADHGNVQTGAIVIRSETVRLAGGMRPDLRISQDLEYWALVGAYGKWGFIPTPLLVSASDVSVPKHGWISKYAKRRRLCPTVEQWESRLVGRIPASDLRHFSVIRGRIAAGYMYAKIVAGDFDGARHILQKYADDMPPGPLIATGKRALACGRLPWRTLCLLVRLREYCKYFR